MTSKLACRALLIHAIAVRLGDAEDDALGFGSGVKGNSEGFGKLLRCAVFALTPSPSRLDVGVAKPIGRSQRDLAAHQTEHATDDCVSCLVQTSSNGDFLLGGHLPAP